MTTYICFLILGCALLISSTIEPQLWILWQIFCICNIFNVMCILLTYGKENYRYYKQYAFLKEDVRRE